jgi:hypothetical protein
LSKRHGREPNIDAVVLVLARADEVIPGKFGHLGHLRAPWAVAKCPAAYEDAQDAQDI